MCHVHGGNNVTSTARTRQHTTNESRADEEESKTSEKSRSRDIVFYFTNLCVTAAKQALFVTMGKSRVAVRLKEKVGGKKSHNKSEDLARLTERYNVFCKRLEGLVAVR
jgi:hypothetical protein